MTENMVTIQGINGEFTLEGWQVEAAYLHQKMLYTIEDAECKLSDYLECYNYLVDDTRKLHIKATEEDYESMAVEFLEGYDFYTDDDNRKWIGIIKRHFGLE